MKTGNGFFCLLLQSRRLVTTFGASKGVCAAFIAKNERQLWDAVSVFSVVIKRFVAKNFANVADFA